MITLSVQKRKYNYSVKPIPEEADNILQQIHADLDGNGINIELYTKGRIYSDYEMQFDFEPI